MIGCGDEDAVISNGYRSGAVHAFILVRTPGKGVVKFAVFGIEAEKTSESRITLATLKDDEARRSLKLCDDGASVARIPFVFGTPKELSVMLV